MDGGVGEPAEAIARESGDPRMEPEAVASANSRQWSSCSSSSIRRRYEMFLAIFDAPTMTPVASRIGETVSEMGTRVPSLRLRTVSKG